MSADGTSSKEDNYLFQSPDVITQQEQEARRNKARAEQLQVMGLSKADQLYLMNLDSFGQLGAAMGKDLPGLLPGTESTKQASPMAAQAAEVQKVLAEVAGIPDRLTMLKEAERRLISRGLFGHAKAISAQIAAMEKTAAEVKKSGVAHDVVKTALSDPSLSIASRIQAAKDFDSGSTPSTALDAERSGQYEQGVVNPQTQQFVPDSDAAGVQEALKQAAAAGLKLKRAKRNTRTGEETVVDPSNQISVSSSSSSSASPGEIRKDADEAIKKGAEFAKSALTGFDKEELMASRLRGALAAYKANPNNPAVAANFRSALQQLSVEGKDISKQSQKLNEQQKSIFRSAYDGLLTTLTATPSEETQRQLYAQGLALLRTHDETKRSIVENSLKDIRAFASPEFLAGASTVTGPTSAPARQESTSQREARPGADPEQSRAYVKEAEDRVRAESLKTRKIIAERFAGNPSDPRLVYKPNDADPLLSSVFEKRPDGSLLFIGKVKK